MSNIQTIGVDLAKNVFSIHGVDAYGECILRKTVKRNKLLDTFANLPPCIISMEACSGAHHWACELEKLEHKVLYTHLNTSKNQRCKQKNNYNDAELTLYQRDYPVPHNPWGT